MFLLTIDKKLNVPVYKQVVSQIKELIETGVLRIGDKLPSTRKLAEQLKLNRTTICRAYDELWVLGLVESNQGANYQVIKRGIPLVKNSQHRKPSINWETRINPVINDIKSRIKEYDKDKKDGVIDFNSLSPDPNLIPWNLLRKAFNEAIIKNRSDSIVYGDYAGFMPF